jgi:siroheme synthase
MSNLSLTGKVTLLGKGSYALVLLTLKAMKALAFSDVLLIDHLANPDIAQFTPDTRAVEVDNALIEANRYAHSNFVLAA